MSAADVKTHAWTVTDAESGRRLDRRLGERLGLSRTQARRLLESGAVHVNGRPVTAKAKGEALVAGGRIEVRRFVHPHNQQISPAPHLPLDVVAEGSGWIIVNKPAGAAVHPYRPAECDTVLNAVAARYPRVQGVGEEGDALRSGVVHRLDRTTTGCLLVALELASWRRFRLAFQQRRIHKTYLALVHGQLRGQREEQHTLLIRQHRPARVLVVEETDLASSDIAAGARPCRLAWRAVETFAHATLLEIDLGTGFLHQIRAIFAHLGHPLLGDSAYGGSDLTRGSTPRARNPVPRPMLHAQSLELDEVRGHCDPPADFRRVVDLLQSVAR